MALDRWNLKQQFWTVVRPSVRTIVRATRKPPVGKIQWGDLRSLKPISRVWGFDRGTPIDRYYIEQFLGSHRNDIRGQVLEFSENTYTMQFGGDKVTRSDVMHLVEGNPNATIIADVAKADHLPDDMFDCIICTQTLQLVFELPAAIRNLHRLLKKDGVLLVTVPGISQISIQDMDLSGDYWRFTSASVRRLLAAAFPAAQCEVQSYGSVMTSMALLQGVAVDELDAAELEARDRQFQLLITAKAVK